MFGCLFFGILGGGCVGFFVFCSSFGLFSLFVGFVCFGAFDFSFFLFWGEFFLVLFLVWLCQ